MRVEEMDFDTYQDLLDRIYETLNRELFDDALPGAKVVSAYCESESENNLTFGEYDYGATGKPIITLNNVWLEQCVWNLASPEEQRDQIAEVVLHEMVHQFCDNAGIAFEDNVNHAAVWREAAFDHGLCSKGTADTEYVTDKTKKIFETITI